MEKKDLKWNGDEPFLNYFEQLWTIFMQNINGVNLKEVQF